MSGNVYFLSFYLKSFNNDFVIGLVIWPCCSWFFPPPKKQGQIFREHRSSEGNTSSSLQTRGKFLHFTLNWNYNTPIHFVGILTNFKPNPHGFCSIGNHVNKFSSVTKSWFRRVKKKSLKNAEIILKCKRHLFWNFPINRDGGFPSLSKYSV